MLQIIPIQFLAPLAYFLLRLFVGGVLIYLGIEHIKHRKELYGTLRLKLWPFGTGNTLALIFIELYMGLSILLGAATQVAALALMGVSLKMIIVQKYISHTALPPRLLWVLLFGCGLSLFITGAGALAFDLPI